MSDDGYDHDHHDDDDGAGHRGGGVDGEPGEGELATLAENLRRAERLLARVVVDAGRLASAGVAERDAGQSLQLWLGTACRQTGADRATLITAGEMLADMPVLRSLFLDGDVSWGQVRAITRLVRRRSRTDRAWLDERLGATFASHEGDLGNVEPDELVAAAERAVDELCDLARREREEADGVAASFVAIQPSFDGGARLYGELDALTTATVVGALDRAAESPQRDEAGQPHTTSSSGWSTTARSEQYAAALARVCGEWAGGHPADSDGTSGASNHDPQHGGAGGAGGAGEASSRPVTGRQPRPVIRVGVNLVHATAATAGTLDVPARGVVPRLTAAAVEALACDATVQAVVFDGARPLATTAKLSTDDIPAAIRTAVEHRDQGCRWPGCDAPLAHCEIHHLVARAMGGTHHPENLACLCRADHLRAHGHQWQLELDGDTGALAGYQGRARKWTTQPRATPLAEPRDPPHGTGDRDPPTDGDGDRDPLDEPPPDDPPPGWGRIVDDDGNPLPF